MTLVTTQIDGPLATITIDSPPLNLFEAQMIGELSQAIEALHADPPRALLIQAKGEVVSGGVNVEEFKGLNPSQGSALWSDLLGLIDRVESLPLPVVFRAHGLTLTAAFELSLACDFIVATMESWNVVNYVWPDDQLEEKTLKLATRLANGPTKAHAMTKRIVRAYVEGGVPAADRVTRREAAELFGTEDLINAVDTFLEQGPGNATFEGK